MRRCLRNDQWRNKSLKSKAKKKKKREKKSLNKQRSVIDKRKRDSLLERSWPIIRFASAKTLFRTFNVTSRFYDRNTTLEIIRRD